MRVRIFSKEKVTKAVDLGLLIQFSICPNCYNKEDNYTTEIYMNELDHVIVELYKHSISKTEPIISSVYEVVK